MVRKGDIEKDNEGKSRTHVTTEIDAVLGNK